MEKLNEDIKGINMVKRKRKKPVKKKANRIKLSKSHKKKRR